MAKKTFTATFSNGETVTRTTEHDYITAWRIRVDGVRATLDQKTGGYTYEFDPDAPTIWGSGGFSTNPAPRGEARFKANKWMNLEQKALQEKLHAHESVEVVPAILKEGGRRYGKYNRGL